jgi:hypothetical protein
MYFLIKNLPPYTLAGFDLTTHNSEGGDYTTRSRRQGNILCMYIFSHNDANAVQRPSTFTKSVGRIFFLDKFTKNAKKEVFFNVSSPALPFNKESS